MLHCHILAIKVKAVPLNSFEETVMDYFIFLIFYVMKWEIYFKHLDCIPQY